MRLGIDIGSTTLKCILLDERREVLFSTYLRHNADISAALTEMLQQIPLSLRKSDTSLRVMVTGSVGMGVAERMHIPFLQEVVAAVETIKERYSGVRTLIDIGGEDSKMIFFGDGKTPDIRMNGSCAGGTGAFLDQTATLLGIDPSEMNAMAEQSTCIYPIASRCGVFSKTDIQNLIARKAVKADIVASVMHAVALQVVGSLARGMDIQPKLFFCGGPFAYMPELRKHVLKVLALTEEDVVPTDMIQYIPAMGCALAEGGAEVTWSAMQEGIQSLREVHLDLSQCLTPLFRTKQDYAEWWEEKADYSIPSAPFESDRPNTYYLGVDSGSTTTKIVIINDRDEVVYTDYQRNNGDSFRTFYDALKKVQSATPHPDNVTLISAATGYGEALLQTAFSLDYGIVETMAHYMAARHTMPEVSFILDIGGQDMKAIWVREGIISRMEINEACSSGCGSFMETFSRMLGYDIADFARMACFAEHPYDLGTRCTVFMNSRVKQAMREGARVEDIAAGFAYSVCKNCLYKVLKLRQTTREGIEHELGRHIVVQGGTMRNHAVVRALEQLTGSKVHFTNMPELMGAYGAALYAKQRTANKQQKC